MRSKYVSSANIIQLAVATAALALCLNLCIGLSMHEAQLQRMYGDRVLSLRAVASETGAPYRFDRYDIDVIQHGLESEGIIVAGLGLSYIDAREVSGTLRGLPKGSSGGPLNGSSGSYGPRGRVLLADVTPLYFEIAGLALSVGGDEGSGLDPSRGIAVQDDPDPGNSPAVQGDLGLDLCVVSDDLSHELFGAWFSGQTLTVSGSRQLTAVAQVSGDHLVPMVDEPTGFGLVHRLGRRVIYRPLSGAGASAGFGYLLFKIREGISLMDGMKSVSRFLVTHYPELQIDAYSEYERFAEHSKSTRSVLITAIVAVLIGYAVAGIAAHASASVRVGIGCDGIPVRIALGWPPSRVAAVLVRRAVFSGVLSGAAGCLLYLAVSAVGVSLPGLPAEVIGTAVTPAVVSMAVTVLTATAASVGPARRASMVDQRGPDGLYGQHSLHTASAGQFTARL